MTPPPDDTPYRPLEAVSQLDHGALTLSSGRLICATLDLSLFGSLAGDHGSDALDCFTHRADLVTATGLANLSIDLTEDHTL